MWFSHSTYLPGLPLPSQGHPLLWAYTQNMQIHIGHCGGNVRNKNEINSAIKFYNLVNWFLLFRGECKMLLRIIRLPLSVHPTAFPPSNSGWDIESGHRDGRAGGKVEHSGTPWADADSVRVQLACPSDE